MLSAADTAAALARSSSVRRFLRFAPHGSGRRARTLPLLSLPAACGFPSPAADCVDERVTLDELLVRRPLSSFLAEAAGDAMIDAGICEGDILVIDRAAPQVSGAIVLASYCGEFLLRRLRFDAQGRPELHPENAASDCRVIRPESGEQFEIEGVAVGLTRRL